MKFALLATDDLGIGFIGDVVIILLLRYCVFFCGHGGESGGILCEGDRLKLDDVSDFLYFRKLKKGSSKSDF